MLLTLAGALLVWTSMLRGWFLSAIVAAQFVTLAVTFYVFALAGVSIGGFLVSPPPNTGPPHKERPSPACDAVRGRTSVQISFQEWDRKAGPGLPMTMTSAALLRVADRYENRLRGGRYACIIWQKLNLCLTGPNRKSKSYSKPSLAASRRSYVEAN
jgi:hypothetical protein